MTTTMRLLQLKLNICNFSFLIMHVVPTRASSPQHIEYNYTHRASSPQLKEQNFTEHQALNVRAKAHRASSPQHQMSMHGLNNVQLRQHHNLYDSNILE
ncbi:hypothetical protein MTR_2g460710 [Medicago truncatula]|uniref:Transmembrane protein n=1 Tax=Medicago truncatula TaxID=3880 RepID=A0A072V9K6_MEDTR|nr:hypothetical protein MTR_2g460710 [Medicago truncatula]